MMETLLSIAVALCAGLLVSRFVKPLKLPAVTGYLIAGILIGPYCLGKLGVPGLGFPTTADVKALSLFNDVALGFIAFAIGNEFRLSQLRQTGKQATVIGIFQALTATLMVDLMLIGLHFFILGDSISVADAIVLGAIATATAPAATLMVVRQYKAKGELTDLLLPIVALDDAVGLIVFAVSFGIAKAINCGNYDMVSILVEPLLEIVFSVLLGFVMGGVFSAAEKYFKSNSKRLSLSITFVILTVALSMMEFEVGGVKIGFSSLLVCMMLGTVFCNVCDFSADMMDKTDKWTSPLYILFFVLSGAELELDVFSNLSVIVVGLVYIFARAFGKWMGASISSKCMKCSPSVQKWLGITLLPQAGVALGMSVTVAQTLGADGELIRNIVLFGVLIYELIGPAMTRIALIHSGDIQPKNEDVVSADD
ncbi:MAG: cation:proton antiporter [Clostridiales bacterium]|nr:cation:proton antiporter [Clostridiales bacterium]